MNKKRKSAAKHILHNITSTYNEYTHTNERSDVTASKGGFPRPPWRSVKKFLLFPVKNEKLFERSEFFSFREKVKILALKRQPAVFLFVIFFFLMTERKSKASEQSQKTRKIFF